MATDCRVKRAHRPRVLALLQSTVASSVPLLEPACLDTVADEASKEFLKYSAVL
jgi:hypothetical protein